LNGWTEVVSAFADSGSIDLNGALLESSDAGDARSVEILLSALRRFANFFFFFCTDKRKS